MKTFLLMLSFLTRIPVPQIEYTEERYRKGIKWMPVIGLLIGFILYGISFVHSFFSSQVTAFLLLFCYIALTGALHLDGLADTCDGVFSGRDRGKKLEIMRDSFIGAFGVLSLILACIAYFVFFTALFDSGITRGVIILMPVIGKTAPILSAALADYVRDSGLGKTVAENCKAAEVIVALLLTFGVSVLIQPFLCIAAALISFSAVVILTARLKKSLGGITGDTLGMVCEVSQLIFLFSLILVQSMILWSESV